jgi:hypothetical protein
LALIPCHFHLLRTQTPIQSAVAASLCRRTPKEVAARPQSDRITLCSHFSYCVAALERDITGTFNCSRRTFGARLNS